MFRGATLNSMISYDRGRNSAITLWGALAWHATGDFSKGVGGQEIPWNLQATFLFLAVFRLGLNPFVQRRWLHSV